MKQLIKIVSLLVIIILTATFISVRLLARGSEDNYFNSNYRSKLTQTKILRDIFALHDNGDGKADYLSKKSSLITVNIFMMDGLRLDDSVIQDLQEKVAAITGKSVLIKVDRTYIPYKDNVSLKEREAYENKSLDSRKSSSLNVLLLSEDLDEPLLLGITFKEHGVVIFNDAIKEFTANSPSTFNPYQLSTILHEFGHQLDLEHHTVPGCLMSEHAELSHVAKFYPEEVIVEFCDYERDLILKN
jgi:hypothetical protein